MPWPGPLAPSRKTAAGHRARLAASRAAARRCTRASSPSAEVQRAHRALLAAVPRGARRGARRRAIARSARSGTSTAIRCRRSATRMPTIRAARAPTSCSAIATARPASRDSPRSSPTTLRGAGLRGRDQRSVQGRRDRAQARPARRAPAQPADRGQAPLYMDEATLEPNAGYARLERDLERVARDDRALVRERATASRRRRAAGSLRLDAPQLVRPLDRSDGALPNSAARAARPLARSTATSTTRSITEEEP